MALSLSETLRNTQLNSITLALNAGTTGALFKIYDGIQPASGGAVTNLLAELRFLFSSFPTALTGTISANPIFGDASANLAGTATWFRWTDSNGVFVLDGTVGTSGADLILNTTAIASGVPVDVTSVVLTASNI